MGLVHLPLQPLLLLTLLLISGIVVSCGCGCCAALRIHASAATSTAFVSAAAASTALALASNFATNTRMHLLHLLLLKFGDELLLLHGSLRQLLLHGHPFLTRRLRSRRQLARALTRRLSAMPVEHEEGLQQSH